MNGFMQRIILANTNLSNAWWMRSGEREIEINKIYKRFTESALLGVWWWVGGGSWTEHTEGCEFRGWGQKQQISKA